MMGFWEFGVYQLDIGQKDVKTDTVKTNLESLIQYRVST